MRAILPSTITTLSASSFSYCRFTKYFLCKALSVPSGFNGCINDSSCPIYVPDDSLASYKSAWSAYSSRMHSFTEFVEDFPDDAEELGIS